MDFRILIPFIITFILILIWFAAHKGGRKPEEPKAEEKTAEEKKWKGFLAERSETILDGVFGLVLGLGAYSLTGFTIGGMGDLIVAVSYFALMFFLICLFWWSTSKWFAVAEYSDALMAINFLSIILLVLMPFSLRLLFIPESVVKDIGMTSFPLVVGALLLSALIANIVILRQKRDIPEEVGRDIRRGSYIFPAISVFLFLSLLIPAGITTQTYMQMYFPQFETIAPEPLKNLPFRVASWWLIIILGSIFSALAEVVQKRRVQASEKEALSPKVWRQTLTRKCRTIGDSVYGLALGLCAYSLTDYALGGMEDIIIALSFFLLTFLLISMFWTELYRCFALAPFFDDTLVATSLLLTFFVTLMPFSLRLAMTSEVAARNVGMTLFPLNMMAAGLSSSAFIALALRRRVIDIPKDDLMELQRFAVFIPVLAVIYIASLFWIPPDATIPPQLANFIPEPLSILRALPFRVLVWWFSFLLAIPILGTIEQIQEWTTHRS
jgi:uncharacterized membrane protein